MLSQRVRAIPILSFWKRFHFSDSQEDKKVDDEIPSLDKIFGPGGLMAAKDSSYEDRPAQIAMANHVLSSFLTKEPNIKIIDAGSGVGKTFGYLVPSVKAQMEKRKLAVNPAAQSSFQHTPKHCKSKLWKRIFRGLKRFPGLRLTL